MIKGKIASMGKRINYEVGVRKEELGIHISDKKSFRNILQWHPLNWSRAFYEKVLNRGWNKNIMWKGKKYKYLNLVLSIFGKKKSSIESRHAAGRWNQVLRPNQASGRAVWPDKGQHPWSRAVRSSQSTKYGQWAARAAIWPGWCLPNSPYPTSPNQ